MNKFLEQAYHIKTNPIIMSQAILDKVSVPIVLLSLNTGLTIDPI